MARIFSCGFETRDNLEMNASGGTSMIYDANRKGYALRQQSSSGSVSGSILGYFSTTATEIYGRMYISRNTTGNNNSIYLYDASATTALIRFSFNGSGNMVYWVGGTSVYTASGTIPWPSIWALFEFHVKQASSGGIIEAKIDGVPIGTYTGNTYNALPMGSLGVTWANAGFVGMSMSFDEIAVNDTSGSYQNTWCGDGYIILLKPNGNGSSSQMTGSDGNSTDNYLLVDDVPHNSDTDYVAGDAAGEKDLYAFENMPTLVGDEAPILVYQTVIARRTNAGQVSYFRAVMKSGATEVESGDLALATTYKNFTNLNIQYVDPDTGSAWTVSGINNLEAGAKAV